MSRSEYISDMEELLGNVEKFEVLDQDPLKKLKSSRGEAAKLAHLIESASLKRKYMTKHYEKIFI